MKHSWISLLAISLACDWQLSDIGSVQPNDIEMKNTFLALGDSYTIGESVDVKFRWPNLLRDTLEVRGIEMGKPEIIATTGWRTDELLAASAKAGLHEYSLVSLLIGVNNQYQGKSVESYEPEFEKLLSFGIRKAGGNPRRVLVLSIPDYGFTPFGSANAERIGREIDAYNAANKRISENYGVRYYDITGISRQAGNDPSLVAEDGLHPSGEQYRLWVYEIMKDTDLIALLSTE